MNLRMIWTLILKDLKLYFANQFFALITGMGLVAYIVIFFLVPNKVDEELELGLYMPTVPQILQDFLADEDIFFIQYDQESELEQAILDGDLAAGFGFPAGSLEAVIQGEENIPVHLYVSSETPDEFIELYWIVLDEFAFLLRGEEFDIEFKEIFMGEDMAGAQIPPDEKMLPLLTVMILIMEVMGLGSLIAAEVQSGTLRALLTTPLTVTGLFVGKGIFGTLFAFAQTLLLMAITGGLTPRPVLIMTALMIGGVLVTGIGFLVGSVGKDLLGVIGWSILAIIILIIPSMAVMIPGIANQWIKLLPSYYLVDTIHRVHNLGAGWGDVWGSLLILAGFSMAFLIAGVVVLQRRMR